MVFLDRIPYPLLIGLAVFMVLAPFAPEPHLLEKLRMLMSGLLTKPVDIFDLFWHLLPAIVLLLKLWRDRSRSDLT